LIIRASKKGTDFAGADLQSVPLQETKRARIFAGADLQSVPLQKTKRARIANPRQQTAEELRVR
jgi:hypothetical protein